MEQIKNNVSKEEVNLILIGNKCDLADRMVEKERGEEMAKNLKIKYFETSALTGQGINEAFEELAKQIFKNKNPNENISRNISITYNKPEDALKKKKGKGCC